MRKKLGFAHIRIFRMSDATFSYMIFLCAYLYFLVEALLRRSRRDFFESQTRTFSKKRKSRNGVFEKNVHNVESLLIYLIKSSVSSLSSPAQIPSDVFDMQDDFYIYFFSVRPRLITRSEK